MTTIISAILFAQAPADVPKDHWAFPAVDALFKEGLLKGYPSGKQPPLKLDKTIKQDLKQAVGVLTQWQVKGLLVGHRDHNGHLRRSEPSNYELAAAIHASWWNTVEFLKDKETPREGPKAVRRQFPEMAKMISMFESQLTKLGANPVEMIAILNDLNDSPLRQFHGERR